MKSCLDKEWTGGRPCIKVKIGDKLLLAFIDTGSTTTLMKDTSLENINVNHSVFRSGRALTSVAGNSIDVISEIDLHLTLTDKLSCIHRFVVVRNVHFPGDILIGMDLLGRFNFTICHRPKHSFIDFGDAYRSKITFNNCASLKVSAIKA